MSPEEAHDFQQGWDRYKDGPGDVPTVVEEARLALGAGVVKRRWFVAVEWKPQDCWLGIFWKRQDRWRTVEARAICMASMPNAAGGPHYCALLEGHPGSHRHESPAAREINERLTDEWADRLDVWVCLVPMVPIHFGWVRR